MLAIDLVPRPFWGSSLANRMPAALWQRCRSWALTQSGGRCTTCGTVTDRLECDEVWTYDGTVRRLAGLRMICRDCHAAKHFGRTAVRRGPAAAAAAMAHLVRVNGWSREQAHAHQAEAVALWQQHNQVRWTRTDTSWLRDNLGIDFAL